MEAILNIYAYNDDGELEIKKTYKCYMLIYDVQKKIDVYSEEINKLDNKRLEELKKTDPDMALVQKLVDDSFECQLNILRAIFPKFQDEEFNGINPEEYLDFMETLGKERKRIFDRASKN